MQSGTVSNSICDLSNIQPLSRAESCEIDDSLEFETVKIEHKLAQKCKLETIDQSKTNTIPIIGEFQERFLLLKICTRYQHILGKIEWFFANIFENHLIFIIDVQNHPRERYERKNQLISGIDIKEHSMIFGAKFRLFFGATAGVFF